MNAIGSSGILDTQRTQCKTQLVRIACDIAAVAERYKKIHHVLFGLSMGKILYALQPDKRTDFGALETELDSIAAESKLIQHAIGGADFDELPKRAKTFIAIRDALKEYAKALYDMALKLKLICQNLRRESEGETEFTDYRATQFRRDKASYDDSIQEFRRWGMRLTGLFDKF